MRRLLTTLLLCSCGGSDAPPRPRVTSVAVSYVGGGTNRTLSWAYTYASGGELETATLAEDGMASVLATYSYQHDRIVHMAHESLRGDGDYGEEALVYDDERLSRLEATYVVGGVRSASTTTVGYAGGLLTSLSRQVSSSDESSSSTRLAYGYDDADRPLTITSERDGERGAISIRYAEGLVEAVTETAGAQVLVTSFAFDDAARLVAWSNDRGATGAVTYGANGFIDSSTRVSPGYTTNVRYTYGAGEALGVVFTPLQAYGGLFGMHGRRLEALDVLDQAWSN